MTRTVSDLTLQRLADVLERLESLLPAQSRTDFSASPAFRWRKRRYLGIEQGELQPVLRPALIPFDDLKHVDDQKEAIRQNTERFVRRLPANNALLTGARGTGKSSLIRACLHEFSARGLRLIEVDKRDLSILPISSISLPSGPSTSLFFATICRSIQTRPATRS